ncbi:MAG: COG1361 S-layer family protein [Candidatus Nanosalina sp.]
MKTTKLALSVLILLLIGTVASQRGQTTQMDATLLTTDPVPLQTGEDADVTFKVVNRGSTQAENVKVKIIDSYPFKLKPDRQRNYSIGSVTPGEAYYISTDILVNEDASDGSHSLKVRISKQDFSKIVEIPLEVQGSEIDLNLANLKTVPDQLMPGTEDNKLSLSVVNNGEKEAENVVVNLDYPSFLQERSSFSKRQALGNLNPGETKNAEFYFDISKDAPKGPVEISTTLAYTSEDSTAEIEKTENFTAYISGKPQYEVVNTSSNLVKGKKGKLEVTVMNTGSEESASTRIRVLDSSDLPLSYASSSQYIGTLEPGEKGTAVFEITPEASAETKDYIVDFEIRGVKDTEVFTEDVTLRLPVKARANSGTGIPSSVPIIAAAVILAGGAYFFRDRIFGSSEPEEGEE